MTMLNIPYQLGALHAQQQFVKQADQPQPSNAFQRLRQTLEKRGAVRSNLHDTPPRRGQFGHEGVNVGVETPVGIKRLRDTMRQKYAAGELPPELQSTMAGQDPNAGGGGGGPSLGDPNFWGGGSQAEQGGGAQPHDAEEAVGLLPGGTFQGLNMKVTAEGEKSVNVKVTPDALQDPNALATFFQMEPGMKIEIAPPEQGPAVQVQPTPGTPGAPGPGVPMGDAGVGVSG